MQESKQRMRWQADELRWSQLMAASHQGDKAAYTQLLTELTGVLTAYLQVQFGKFELVEDCVQECLLAVHKARHTYDPARDFRPWLFTIARHKTIDVLRQSNRHMTTVNLLEEVDDVSAEGFNRVLDGAKMMLRLSADHREVLVMTKYFGLTTLEAAESIGISESAVKARLRRGLNIIKKDWEAESIYP
jgi:RNA polymerase sigma-70 factor (ECF subfamily)